MQYDVRRVGAIVGSVTRTLHNAKSQKLTLAITIGLLIGATLIVLLVFHRLGEIRRAETPHAPGKTITFPTVTTMRVERAPGTALLTLPGNTAAWHETAVYARVGGYVGKWYVDIGDKVTKGQVLAAIETPELDAALAEAKAKFQSATAITAAREADAAFAKTTYERWKNAPAETVSEQDRETKKADWQSADARLNAAEAEADAARDELDGLATLRQFKFVTAPFAGTIIERRVDVGDLVTAGSTHGVGYLFRLSDDDPIRVFADAPQSATAELSIGQVALVTVIGATNRCYRSSIARTAQALNLRARTLRIEVDVPNMDGTLLPGLYVTVQLEIKTAGKILVPSSAVTFRARGAQIAIVDASNVVHFHAVSIIAEDGNFFTIDADISPGDRIILNVNNEIHEGQKVNASDIKSMTDYAARLIPPPELNCGNEGPY